MYAVPPRPAPAEGDPEARERILRTAYELFRAHGFNAVGVDRIVAESGAAKTTLYRHFHSKDELMIAVLERNEEVWTGWLEREAERARSSGGAPILALFDALAKWFGHESYEGCLFINSVLETHDRASPVHAAATASMQNVYKLLRRLAEDAGARDPQGFAQQLQLVMRGTIVAAVEGNAEAVAHARSLARLLIERATQP
jgi:AcrR family transcriptional regulator